MALALHERGLFTWPEWAATLADEIKRAQARATPIPAKPTTGIGSPHSNASSPKKAPPTRAALARYRDAWHRAAGAPRTAPRSRSHPKISPLIAENRTSASSEHPRRCGFICCLLECPGQRVRIFDPRPRLLDLRARHLSPGNRA